MTDKREIYLGFAKKLDKTDVVSVRRQYLPLGKIGGKPAWLNPTILPTTEQVSCKHCGSTMPFLLQIYCPGKADHSFHRYIYVFICSNVECYKTPKQTCRILRCQLPFQNDFIAEKKINFEIDGEVADPCYDEKTFMKTCAICGCYAAKFCAKCKNTYYCCVAHQKIDWKYHDCNPKKIEIKADKSNPFLLPKENDFVFKEHCIDMGYDDDVVIDDDSEDDDDGSEDEDNETSVDRAKKQIAELNLKDYGNADELLDLDEKKDNSYRIFLKAIKRNPIQILRYDRNGVPLSATDYISLPKNIPNCPNCKAERKFEFQITPHILSEIEERGTVSPIDFATIIIYTCSNDCQIPNNGYIEEYAFKQDFIINDDNNFKIENGNN